MTPAVPLDPVRDELRSRSQSGATTARLFRAWRSASIAQPEPVGGADAGQHVGRVGALPAPGLEQPQGLAAVQQPLQQQPLGTAGEQAGAELAEHGGVEPRVGQLEAEQVLPVDPGADGVGGRAVGEVLAELEDGDQGQPPGREGGLPPEGVEVGEVGVVEDGAEFVAEPEVGVAVGEGGTGDAGGILGDGRDEPELERHGATSGKDGGDMVQTIDIIGVCRTRREFASSIKSAGEPVLRLLKTPTC